MSEGECPLDRDDVGYVALHTGRLPQVGQEQSWPVGRLGPRLPTTQGLGHSGHLSQYH